MKNIHQLMKSAVSFQKQGKLHETARLLDDILKKSPVFVPALNLRGMLHLRLRQYSAAAGKFEQALKVERKNFFAHENLARALMYMGQHDRAREHFENSIKINPSSSTAIVGLGNVLMSQGKYEAALKTFNRAASSKNARPELYLNLGLVNEKLGRFDEAIQSYNKATSLEPGSPNGDVCLGKLYLGRKKFPLAEIHFSRAMELGLRSAEIEVCLAQSLFKSGKEEQAREHFFKATERDPGFQGAYIELDNFLLFSGSDKKRQLIQDLSGDYLYTDWEEPLSVASRLGSMYEYPDTGCLEILATFWKTYQPGELHDHAWWTKQLGKFGDPVKGHDKLLRGIHSAIFSWSLPDTETLSLIADFTGGTRLRSYGAGSGLWERLLKDHFGISVMATDCSPRHRFLQMGVEDFSDAEVVESDTIFLAWIIAENTSVLNILDKMYPEQKLIFIGEPPSRKQARGLCASPAIFSFLSEHFVLEKTATLVSFSHLNDTCSFYRKVK